MIATDKKSKSFTLIELLVVISILSLLSSVVFASVNTARSKARDSKRVADLLQIQRAVELYYNEKGYYPGQQSDAYYMSSTPYLGGDCGYPYPPNWPSGVWCSLETALRPYIPSLPRDNIGNPIPLGSYRYRYKYNDVSKKYALTVVLENPTAQSQNDGGWYANQLEIGPLPTYCKTNFNLSWDTWDYACSCGTGGSCRN